MPEFHLNLLDRPRVVDFLVGAMEYAGSKSRSTIEKLVRSYQGGEKVETEKLANAARKLAKETWPARTALHHYLTREGKDEEWDKVLKAVRPSTAHLMKRFKDAEDLKTLDEVLEHPEASTVIRDEERYEIEEVRGHVRHDIWKAKAGAFEVLVKTYQKELDGYTKRLDALRELAANFPPALQDEIFSKINHYEDRILFGEEIIPLEILDEEIKYYRDQKEISPLET